MIDYPGNIYKDNLGITHLKLSHLNLSLLWIINLSVLRTLIGLEQEQEVNEVAEVARRLRYKLEKV